MSFNQSISAAAESVPFNKVEDEAVPSREAATAFSCGRRPAVVRADVVKAAKRRQQTQLLQTMSRPSAAAASRLARHSQSNCGLTPAATRCRRFAAGGFSLIEVMVVVVILGLLAGAVAIKVGGYMDTAKTNRAKSDIATIVDAIESQYLTTSKYPTNDEGLEGLPLKNTNDPWGRPYEYNSPGEGDEPYEVLSLGADGRPGGEGIDGDIYSYDLGEVTEAP